MKNTSYIPKFKYAPKPWASLLFFILILIVFLLFLGRKNSSLRPDVLMGSVPDFYQHISNFAISYLLYAGIGYMWLMAGVSIKLIRLFGAVIILSNLIYEMWIPVLNTPDITDAYYGVAGAVIGFAFLFVVSKYGLKLNPSQETPEIN